MTEPTERTRYAIEYPDGKGTLGQDPGVLLGDEVIDHPHVPGFDFYVVNDEKTGIYEAIVGDTAIAGLPYNVAGDDRLVLMATSVLPEYRRQGVATELIRRVLDDVRSRGMTVTIRCPTVRTFIEHNPEYADLIDPEHPGRPQGRTSPEPTRWAPPTEGVRQ